MSAVTTCSLRQLRLSQVQSPMTLSAGWLTVTCISVCLSAARRALYMYITGSLEWTECRLIGAPRTIVTVTQTTWPTYPIDAIADKLLYTV